MRNWLLRSFVGALLLACGPSYVYVPLGTAGIGMKTLDRNGVAMNKSGRGYCHVESTEDKPGLRCIDKRGNRIIFMFDVGDVVTCRAEEGEQAGCKELWAELSRK